MSIRLYPKNGIAKRVAQKRAQYNRIHEDEGSFIEDENENDRPPIRCRKCGTNIPREAPGSDVDCPKCGQTHNCFGQQIDFPHGQGEDYAGERYEDDY